MGINKKDKCFETLDIDKMKKEIEKRWSQWWYPAYWWLRYGIWNYLEERPRAIKRFFQRGYRGWADEDVWDFCSYLSKVIYEGLIHLKAHKGGYPLSIINETNGGINDTLNKAEWNLKLDKMIYAFKLAKEIGSGEREYYLSHMDKEFQEKYKCLTFEENNSMKEGFKLFSENFHNLWD